MTLEKLLIFGLALAVVTAFAFWADDAGEARGIQSDGYKDKVNALMERAK